MAKTAESFSVNDRVRHAVFGLGTIREMSSRYTTIAFDEHGTRKFIAEMVRLEHSDSPAPAKAPRKAKSPKKPAAPKAAAPAPAPPKAATPKAATPKAVAKPAAKGAKASKGGK